MLESAAASPPANRDGQRSSGGDPAGKGIDSASQVLVGAGACCSQSGSLGQSDTVACLRSFRAESKLFLDVSRIRAPDCDFDHRTGISASLFWWQT